jgi:hypothetical protein
MVPIYGGIYWSLKTPKPFIETNKQETKASTHRKLYEAVEVYMQPTLYLCHEHNRVDPISNELIALSEFAPLSQVQTEDWYRL